LNMIFQNVGIGWRHRMDIHMFNKVKKTVNNTEMLLKINV
jgi:hypothetical protein